MTLAFSSRRWAWLLIASLALNLFLAAAIAMHWRPHGDREPSARLGPIDRTAARAALAEPHRARVDAIWAEHGERMHATMRDFRQARREVERRLYAEPFDRAALERAHAVLAEHSAAARLAMESLVIEIAEALPVEARRQYFEAGQRRHWRGGERERPSEAPSGGQGER